jgi:hypothetical protein
MDDLQTLVRDEMARAGSPSYSFNDLERRRDRKRRNQRIAAGVVGIAVFIAAVWIVTSGLSLDRSERSVAPAGEVTGPAETGPAETGPPPARASGAPDVVRWGECHPPQGSEVRLELWDVGDRIRVLIDLSSMDSPRWRVVLRHTHLPAISPPEVVFRGTKVTRDSVIAPPSFRIIRQVTDLVGVDEFQAKSVATQTGQVCKVVARIG